MSDAWAAPTPNGVSVGAGYFTLTNHQNVADRLIVVSSSRAPRVEIHEMAMDGDVMRMRAVGTLELEPGAAVTLAPGGRHLMFYNLTAPLAPGDMIDVKLTFEHAGEIDVTLNVRQRGAEGGHSGH